MPESLQNLLTRAQESWVQLPRQARIIIPTVAVIILGGLIALSFWSSGSEWTELVSGLNSIELRNIQSYIEQNHHVETKIDHTTGTILVPADAAAALWMQLDYNDVIPDSRANLLDVSESGMLTTPDQALAKRQRDAERKLQASIESLRPVYRASVALTLPKEAVFLEDEQPAKAAVNLKLHPGQKLAPKQVDAIYKLIVNSVAGLSRENVTVLDADGNLLLGEASDRNQMDSTISNWEYQQQQAKDLERKVKDVLVPVVGSEQHIRVGIHVDSDFDQTEEKKRTYVNDGGVLLQEETTDEVAQGDVDAGLPPGTASNVIGDGSLANSNSKPPVTIQRKQGKKEYQPSLQETTTVLATGTIKRVTAAVNIRNNEAKPWTPEQLAQFEELVKTAIGFDQKRGDLVTVSSFAFASPGASADTSLLDRLLVYLPDVAKYGVVGLLGFMLLLLLRSVMGTLHIGETVEPEMLSDQQPVALEGSGRQDAHAVTDLPGTSSTSLEKGPFAHQMLDFTDELSPAQLELQALQRMVERMIREDPDAIARVIDGWIGEDRDDFDLLDEE